VARNDLSGIGFLLVLVGLPGCKNFTSNPPDGGLVDLATAIPGIHLDLRYATANNFTGHPLYRVARGFLLKQPAEALARVQASLRAQGYSLLIYDAYRPWQVTRRLWDAASPEDRHKSFVADPVTGSRHNRGCAVDTGLYDLAAGKEVPMPTEFDEFSPRAHARWKGASAATARTRDMLRQAMEAEGYRVLEHEWWHFNYAACDHQPILDVALETL
jgi:D-alanyl-D-alanine dipeptidase